MNKEELTKAKKAYAISQKCGAHFISASLIIWIFIAIVSFLDISLYYKNALSLYSSVLLMPLALLFSKIYKIKFSDNENPLNSAGIIFALNQMLYLIVVILVWIVKPEQMITAYAIVVGAHFLPYSWLYDSKTYRVVSIVIPVLAFSFALAHISAFTPFIMIGADIVMVVIFLFNKSITPDA